MLLVSLIRCAKLRSPDCLLPHLLMMAIWSSRHRTLFCHYCWGQSGLSSLATSDDGNPDCLLSHYCWGQSGLPQDFPTAVDEFCLPVKVSPCFSHFAASQNTTTSQPGHGFLECLHMAPEGLGSESWWKCWARGLGLSHENFRQFYPCLPPEKAKFLFCLACPLPPCGFLLSILAPKWAASTLTLCTQQCVPASHLHVPHQNSTSTHFSTA